MWGTLGATALGSIAWVYAEEALEPTNNKNQRSRFAIYAVIAAWCAAKVVSGWL